MGSRGRALRPTLPRGTEQLGRSRVPNPLRTILIKPKQSLGQNFLVDDNIARKIAREMNFAKDDVLVEVGPGKGALTKHLVGTAQHLLAFEIDQRLIVDLQAAYSREDVTVFHQDFLEVSLEELCRTYGKPVRVVGNLPYHLTSPILFKTFEQRTAVADLTVMVQKEVAQRIVGQPSTKEYGILAVLSRFYGEPKVLFNVSPGCFFPRPKVDSAVVNIALHRTLPFHVAENFFTLVVKTTFGKRRKTLRNSLQFLPFEPQQIDRITEANGALLKRRPEELSVAEFAMLAKSVQDIVHAQRKPGNQ